MILTELDNSVLTSDMRRSRAGSTMYFNEPGNDSLQNEDADFVIKSPKPELFADLIDGKWQWVNGCPECNGEKPQWAYVKCDKHNVCITCGIARKELKEAPWGKPEGFRCSPCQQAIDDQIKAEALERVASKDYDEYDYLYQDVPKCPHCASAIHGDTHDINEGKDTCEVCGGGYSLEKQYDVTYSTEVIGERITPDGK